VLVVATLGALERRRTLSHPRRKGKTQAQLEPEPSPVATGRATIIDVAAPLPGLEAARAWLAGAGEADLASDLAVLNRTLHAFRVAMADPFVHPVKREQTLVARLGFGAGDRVADGQWTEAHELPRPTGRRRRASLLVPQARLAAVLTGRQQALACEELALRARLDFDHRREREAALQLVIALDAAIAELPLDPAAPAIGDRLAELRSHQPAVADAARAALTGPLSPEQREAVALVLGRLEAALRARAFAGA
jgi:hypothetical protein